MSKQTVPLASKMFTEASYDSDSCTMELTFSKGKSYEYYDFPPDEWAKFLAAESAGRYFLQHIKGQARYARVPETAAQECA